MSTVVALHAHPDDESSKGAGAMARLSEEGRRCVLVCATGGEAGDILNPAMDRPGVRERIAELRREELQAAAAIIGYDEVVHLGYRDSGMAGSSDNARPEAVPLIVAPAFTARRALSLHEALERRGLESPLAGRVAGMHRDDDDGDLLVRVRVAGYIERAREALRAHATQIDPDGRWFAVPLDVAESVYPYEDFEVLAAQDGAVAQSGLFEPWATGPASP
jgi:LmbE family N-acetylglucosaminyl deacetylase